MMHRSRATLATASLLLLCSAAAFTQGLRWTKAAPFPEPDEELYGIAANGKMYVLGGFGTARGKNYEYDAAADKWTKKAPMPRPAHHQAMVEYQGKIYVFGGFVAPMTGPQGGWEPIDNAWSYDPATDQWRNLAPMPIKRGSAAANLVNGKVYVMGGATTAEGSKDVAISGATTANNLVRNDVYDIASNSWSAGAPMALPRNHMFSGTVNGKIYIIGGRVGHAFVAASQNTDIVEQYDPATNTSAAAGAGQDRTVEVHVAQHDVLELPASGTN